MSPGLHARVSLCCEWFFVDGRSYQQNQQKTCTQVTGFGLPIHPNNNEGNERQQNVITKDEQITKI